MVNQNETKYELELIQRGRKQLRRQLDDRIEKGYYSNTDPGRYAFHRYIERLAATLEEVTDDAHQGLILRTNISACCQEIRGYIDYLEHGALLLSSITLKSILDSYSRSKAMAEVQQIANDIGRRIEDEIWFEFEQRRLATKDAERMRREASMPGSNPHYRKRGSKEVAKKAAAKKGLKPLQGWKPTHKARVGLYMLEVARSAGIIPWDKAIKYGKNQTVIYSDKFMNDILGYEELVMARAFHAYPLIDTPLDWNGDVQPSRRNSSGGYHLPELRRNQ